MREKIDFSKYSVSDREIFDENGKKLKIMKNGTVKIVENGTRHYYQAARVIFEICSGKNIPDGYIIGFVDGDRNNILYDNLRLISRKEYFQNTVYEKKISKETQEKIRKEYDRERRRALNFMGEAAHPSYRELSLKYGCSVSTILKITKGIY